jgi:vacuolar protein sorting-associated protein 72
MAEEQEDTPMRTEEEEESESGSGSGSGSGSESEEEQVEWLATTREKRATAGNRLASLLQQEEPDDELELLFQEDEDDVGFEDAEADASDVQMDSSSDEEDQGPAAGDDDLDGEKEIQRQDKAERQAKKRKLAQVPGLKRKKVKIDPRIPMAPAPRPKKKSERASWLPTAEEAPTRASARKTTKLSKEQLHQQMLEREIKRLRQLANMEKAQAAKEAAKKPELTQADRLAEAARVEKSNAKSLSRWEESENLREEQQREKLAALHNRHLEGPVITWWSGMAEYIGGKLRKVGKNLILEDKEKAATKKRKAAEMEAAAEAAAAAETGKPADASSGTTKPEDASTSGPAKPEDGSTTSGPGKPEDGVTPAGPAKPEDGSTTSGPVEETTPNEVADAGPSESTPNKDLEKSDTSQPKESAPSDISAPKPESESAPPKPDVLPLPSDTVEEAPPVVTPAPIPGPPRSSFLAPPAGLPLTAPPPPPPKNSVQHPPFILAPPTLDGSAPLPGFGYNFPRPQLMPSQATPFTFNPPQPPPSNLPPPPPAIEHEGFSYVIFQNFDETAIKEKGVQTQVLIGRKFEKVKSKSSPSLF